MNKKIISAILNLFQDRSLPITDIITTKTKEQLNSILDSAESCTILNTIAKNHEINQFNTKSEQLKDILDNLLSVDTLINEIVNCSTASELMLVQNKIDEIPLTRLERRVYQEVIDCICSDKFDTYSVKRAVEEEKRKILQAYSASINDVVQNVKMGIVLVDNANSFDVCVSNPIAIIDESTGEKSGWYKQIVSKVDAINDNVRLYPKYIYQPALDELKKAGFPNAGEHPHPPSYIGADGKTRFQTSIPNSAVKFRDAYIDSSGNVWAEYKTLATEMGKQVQEFIDNNLPFGFSNRMLGTTIKKTINDNVIDVASSLKLLTWDVVLNPAEADTFSKPIEITDAIKEYLNKGAKNMNFFEMSLEELYEWKNNNKSDNNIALCDQIIAIKEKEKKAEERVKELQDEIKLNEEIKNKELKKVEAQKLLVDEVNKLTYDEKTKTAIVNRGKDLADSKDVKDFIKHQQEFVDEIIINTNLKNLGIPQSDNKGKATIIINDINPVTPIIDGLMSEMDRELQKKDPNFKIDKNLREANKAIIDNALKQLERENIKDYKEFMKQLNDSIKAFTDSSTPAIGTTGEFAQSASISLAILYQTWQDSKFLQLALTEGFSGTTFKMPVEFQSHDLFTEDDFSVGELDGIPTESIQTFILEFGAQWLKRGFIITKEAEKEMLTGPLRYDVIARNSASIAARFNRIIDKMISTEMIARADEYQAKQVKSELVASSEFEELIGGVNAPIETNAKSRVKLLCGNTSPLTASSVVAPVVRPRVSVWLDPKGRKQQELINEIIVKVSNIVLNQGSWNSSKGQIVNIGNTIAQYAVDYENSMIYFVEGVISSSSLPTIEQYSYATNLAYFNLTVPTILTDFPARYYNKLLEMIDIQKAYMGSVPRFITPDFLLGSLNAMVPLKQAELFYQRALPDGTSLLGGEMYFGRRNGIELGEHNTPWVAGDNRLLLGKRNAVRVGMGSPYDLEGPFPHIAGEGKGYTSAKEYFATQQIAINTPLVIDENGTQYHPPFRTIKYYNSPH